MVPTDTADAAATIDTRGVYLGLRQAVSRTTSKLIIGQELRGFDGDDSPTTAFDQPITGLSPRPSLLEVDLKDFWSYFHLDGEVGGEGNGQPRAARVPGGGSDGWKFDHDEKLFTVLIKHLNDQISAGRNPLLGFCFHVGNPFNPGGGADDRHFQNPDGSLRKELLTLTDLAQLDDPATPAGGRWRQALDRVAEIINQINTRVVGNSGAPRATILLRPLHESNQDFFWWGRYGQAAFHTLWQHLFNYMTTTKNLHNLLWVYSVTNKQDPQNPLDNFTVHYPGDNLVDVVGMDLYSDVFENDDNWYGELRNLGKPIAITEYGPSHGSDGSNQSNPTVINAIHKQHPDLVYATCWYSDTPINGNRFQISDKSNPSALLTDPWSITIP